MAVLAKSITLHPCHTPLIVPIKNLREVDKRKMVEGNLFSDGDGISAMKMNKKKKKQEGGTDEDDEHYQHEDDDEDEV